MPVHKNPFAGNAPYLWCVRDNPPFALYAIDRSGAFLFMGEHETWDKAKKAASKHSLSLTDREEYTYRFYAESGRVEVMRAHFQGHHLRWIFGDQTGVAEQAAMAAR